MIIFFESYEEVPGGHNVYKLKSNRKYGLFSKDFQQYFAPYYDDIISYQTEKMYLFTKWKIWGCR